MEDDKILIVMINNNNKKKKKEKQKKKKDNEKNKIRRRRRRKRRRNNSSKKNNIINTYKHNHNIHICHVLRFALRMRRQAGQQDLGQWWSKLLYLPQASRGRERRPPRKPRKPLMNGRREDVLTPHCWTSTCTEPRLMRTILRWTRTWRT